MRQLSTNDPKVIWSWGVCQSFRDAAKVTDTAKGKEQIDAHDVLAMDTIRPIDKLWLLLRVESLPIEILRAACDRIRAGLPEGLDETLDAKTRGRSKLIVEYQQAGDFWSVAHRTAHVAEKLKLRTLEEEHARQLAIVEEEIAAWQKADEPNEETK